MAFSNYPYTNYSDKNLDFLLGKIGVVEKEAAEAKAAAEVASAAKVSAENAASSAGVSAAGASGSASSAAGSASSAAASALSALTYLNESRDIAGRIQGLIPDDAKEILATGTLYNTTPTAKITVDFSRYTYVKFENTGTNAVYVAVQTNKDATQINNQVELLNPGAETIITTHSINTSGAVPAYVAYDHSFLEYDFNVKLSLINDSSGGVTYEVYQDIKAIPIKNYGPLTNVVVVDNTLAEGTYFGVFRYINSALEYLKNKVTVANRDSILFIRNGRYEAHTVDSRASIIEKGSNRISIIGESREGVVIYSNQTPAHNNKILEIGGPCIVANLTLNNYFTDDGSAPDWSHNPYCIHNDTGFTSATPYATIVENCDLYSELYCPVGAGFQNRQTQIYRNCKMVFNTPVAALTQQGALFVHAAVATDDLTEQMRLVVDSCDLISKCGTFSISLPNVLNGGTYNNIPCEFMRNVLYTNGIYRTEINDIRNPLIEPWSGGNNTGALNKALNDF